MKKLALICIFFIILIDVTSTVRGYKWSGRHNTQRKYEAEESKRQGYQNNLETDTERDFTSAKVRRGLGISAWGIIALILSLIFTGLGFYYFTMCYPILCKKERNYDMIEMAQV